jgi:hypothetical protein
LWPPPTITTSQERTAGTLAVCGLDLLDARRVLVAGDQVEHGRLDRPRDVEVRRRVLLARLGDLGEARGDRQPALVAVDDARVDVGAPRRSPAAVRARRASPRRRPLEAGPWLGDLVLGPGIGLADGSFRIEGLAVSVRDDHHRVLGDWGTARMGGSIFYPRDGSCYSTTLPFPGGPTSACHPQPVQPTRARTSRHSAS